MASCGKRAGGLLQFSADDWACWFAHVSCLWSSHWVQRCRRRCLSSLASHLISYRLVSSCRANSISLLLFLPDLFFSQAISRSAKQGAWGGNIANLHWKGGHSKPHTYLFHHPITIFPILPFLTAMNLAGSRTATTSRSIGRLGY